MKRILLIAFFVGVPSFAPAQSVPEPGYSQMEKGAQMFLDGMMREMAPALESLSGLAEKMGPAMRGFAKEMGPALGEILDRVEDWSDYEPPQMLPNGDIIIKRKPEPPSDERPPAIYLDENPQVEI